MCLERNGQNIEIWPWSLRANKSSIFIDLLKENVCLERHDQNIEIWPWILRANKSSMPIDLLKENVCLERHGQNIDIWPWSALLLQAHKFFKISSFKSTYEKLLQELILVHFQALAAKIVILSFGHGLPSSDELWDLW